MLAFLPRKANRWPGEWIFLEVLLNECGEAIQALPHVGIPQSQMYLHAGRHDHHRDLPLNNVATDCIRIAADRCEDTRPSSSTTTAMPSESCKRSLRTSAANCSSVTVTMAGFAAGRLLKPCCTRQPNNMLVTMPWRRQISAAVGPGSSDLVTIVSFPRSVKQRRFARPPLGGSLIGLAVKRCSAAAPSAALLIFGNVRPPVYLHFVDVNQIARSPQAVPRDAVSTRVGLQAHAAPVHRLNMHRPVCLNRFRADAGRQLNGSLAVRCRRFSRSSSAFACMAFASASTFNQRRNVFSPRRCWRQYLRIPRPPLCRAST